MSSALKDTYYTLKDLLDYAATVLSVSFSEVTYANLYATFNNQSSGVLNSTNLTYLETAFTNYIIPAYMNNSCFKITQYYYEDDLEVSEILSYDEMLEFVNRLRLFTYRTEALVDQLIAYNSIIGNLGTGASRSTTAVLKNNDTPQISGSGATQNDGYTNNVQINTGTESNTISTEDHLDALAKIRDIYNEIAKEFRNQVLID